MFYLIFRFWPKFPTWSRWLTTLPCWSTWRWVRTLLKPHLHEQWHFQFLSHPIDFCQAVHMILPGAPTVFEIGIFLSLSDFVQCDVCQSDAYKNWTDGLAKSVSQQKSDRFGLFHVNDPQWGDISWHFLPIGGSIGPRYILQLLLCEKLQNC